MIVAIDGPAGVGKSSVARACAATFSLLYINSGLLYRLIALRTLQPATGIHASDRLSMTPQSMTPSILSKLYQSCVADEQEYARCYTAQVDQRASEVSTAPEVRAIVNATIELLERGRDCIVEGRDIASVVHQNAELKIYLDAKLKTRAARRANQQSRVYSATLKDMQKRDKIDYRKEVGRLTIRADAYIVDTTYLSFSEVCEIVSRYITDTLRKQ